MRGGETTMTEIKYGELARKATKEVAGLEEPMKSNAYKTILDELIKDAKAVKPEAKDRRAIAESTGPPQHEPVAAFMGRAVDASSYGSLFASKGFLVEKGLAVL